MRTPNVLLSASNSTARMLTRTNPLRAALMLGVAAAAGFLACTSSDDVIFKPDTTTATDAGSTDAGPLDSGPSDTGAVDSAPRDASVPPSDAGALALPRIPWEGADYWKQFSKANAAGWATPSFFPILAFFEQFSSDAEVKFDKSIGINTYMGLNSTTDFALLPANGMFYIGESLNATFDANSPNWVGYTMCDECEQNTQAAVDTFISQRNALPKDGRFKTANYSQQIVGAFGTPSIWEQWVNATDVVSLDMYWYTLPSSSFTHASSFLVPVTQPRTAASYGKMVKAMRIRDASDGKLQPLWMFIENVNGGPGEGPFYADITTGQLKGAAMSSIINEARGIHYFNSSLTGPCLGNPMFRHVEYNANDCAAPQTQAAKEVNLQVQSLAPVINTQSYQYSFGSGLDTMLKTKDNATYIFAMIDGSSQPGARTFQLPPGVTGSSVEVLFENRKLAIDSSRKFQDSFQFEYSYHVYKITNP